MPGRSGARSTRFGIRARISSRRVLFTEARVYEEHTRGVGVFVALPVDAADVTATVERLLKSAGQEPG